MSDQHTHQAASGHSETEKIKHLIDGQIQHLVQKRKEVQSKVQVELDDIDRALRHLGYDVPGAHSSAPSKRRRRSKITDDQIKDILRSFMKPGSDYSGAQILEHADLKASRFANFKARQKDFLKTHGAKRAMRYSLGH